MSQSDLLRPLVDAIETVKRRIQEHGASLRENETRTRVALIDPILEALGWDVSDPQMVTPEFRVSAGRADYALLSTQGKAIVALEAKKLGESLTPHRQQMVNYANTAGVGYAGLTAGANWEVYRVFTATPLPLTERIVMSANVAEAPSHESALKLLSLWRPNIVSAKPIPAEEPLVGSPTSTNGEQPLPPEPPLPEASWTPLREVTPTQRNRPSRLRLPGNNELPVKSWPDVMRALVDWMFNNDRFPTDIPQLRGKQGAVFLDGVASNESLQKVGNLPIYLYAYGNGDLLRSRFGILLDRFFESDAHLVEVRLPD